MQAIRVDYLHRRKKGLPNRLKGEILEVFVGELGIMVTKCAMTKKVRDEIDFILSLRIDGAVEKPSFGRLGNLDCAMAIVNLFYDWRCEEEWYEFPSDALHVLEECVGVVKEALAGCVVPEEKYEVARLALENGTYLLETSTSLKENSI